MRITDVEVIILRVPPAGQPCEWGWDGVLVLVHTDAGITGVGESDTSPYVVKAFIEAAHSNLACFGLREVLIGENPLEIQRLWSKMYDSSSYMGRRGVGIHAISAVDIALWDIASQYYKQPIHMLLGGKFRDHIPAYGTFIPVDNPDDNRRLAAEVKARGFKSMKFGGGSFGLDIEHDYKVVKAVRSEVGDDTGVMIDMVSRCKTWNNALFCCKRLEEFNLGWVEEPVPSDDLDGYCRLAQAAPQTISGGEILATRWEFKDFMERGRPGIVQPDITRCGGISEMVRIGHLAELNGMRLVPHGFSTGILLQATIQFLAAYPDGNLIEYSQSASPLFTDLTGPMPKLKNGALAVPDLIGLGSALDWDCVKKYRIA